MEDARFVLFTEDDGSITYYATYTAYDGSEISQQLLADRRLSVLHLSPLVGPAARNKGLALFPRRIGGRTPRCRARTARPTPSPRPTTWRLGRAVAVPAADRAAWEVLQLGNCGSPIETEAGWLVLTHGVGPMRTYSIGAILLDLDDPTRCSAG